MEDNKKPEENKKPKPKRYYWLKLRKEFFKQKTIKKMRQLPGGDVYALIFLEMLTISTETEGVIYFDGVESTPEEELALVLDEDVNAVRMTVNMLRMLHLLEDCDNGDYFLPDAIKMTGSESESAERVRRSRAKHNNNEGNLLKSVAVDDSHFLERGKGDNQKVETDENNNQKVKISVEVTPGAGPEVLDNKTALHCNNDVTKCNMVVTKEEIVDNSTGLMRGITDKRQRNNISQKVKNVSEAAIELDFGDCSEQEPLHCNSDVTKCNEHKEIELELEKEKVLTNHPTDYNHSSLKSAIDTNCNVIRANARAIEENNKPDDVIPKGTSLHQESPVTEVKTSMVGWMDDDKNNLKNENEIEPLFQKYMKEYPRPVKMQEPAKAVFRELVREYGVDPYDLIEAAARYTKKVLEEKTMERFMTVPQNFLADLMWVKYIGPTRKRCPICHGEGYYDDGRGMAICKCTKRYSEIPKLDNHMH